MKKQCIFLIMLISTFCDIKAIKIAQPEGETDFSERVKMGESLRAKLLNMRQNKSGQSMTTEELLSDACHELTPQGVGIMAHIHVNTPRYPYDIHPNAIQIAQANAARYPLSACAELASFWEITNMNYAPSRISRPRYNEKRS